MSITAAPPPPGSAPRHSVLYLDWETCFRPWLTGRRVSVDRDGRQVQLPPCPKPGQHIAVTGKTGYGKTTLIAGILDTRKYVLALDPKGEDETLAATGYRRVTGLPPRKRWPKDVQKDMDEGRPVRLIVGNPTRTREGDEANRRLMGEAIEYARQAGGWTLYVDEFQILADQRMYRLGGDVERMLISARRDATTLITAFQAPAWVPKSSTRQSRHIVSYATQDEDMIQAIGRAAGRPWRHIQEAMGELPDYHVLWVPDKIKAPMLITKAPKIN